MAKQKPVPLRKPAPKKPAVKKPAAKKVAKRGRKAAEDIVTPLVSAEDAAATFAHEVTTETYTAIHDEVLKRWHFTCAITGDKFAPSDARPHPDLEIVAIRPLGAGGPLHTANFLPLCTSASRAFEQGLVVIADDFEIWTGMARIGTLLEGVIPLGRLRLPARKALWPDLEQVRWHRAQILGPDETA